MKILISTFCLILLVLPSLLFGQGYQWQFAGWYGGGAFPKVVYDPHVKDRVYLVSDVTGLFRSDTGGERWRLITKGLTNVIGATLVVSPSDSNLLFSGMKDGLYRSTDAGALWTKVSTLPKNISFVRPQNYKSITLSKIHPGRLCIGTAKGDIYCSHDTGNSWVQLDVNGEVIPKHTPIVALHFDEQDKGLWVAHKKGLSWYDFQSKEINHLLDLEKGANDLVVNPRGMYVGGGQRVYSSFDAGHNWNASTPFSEGEVFRIEVLNEKTLYAAVNRGWRGDLYVSKNQGQSWEPIAKQKEADLEGNPTRAWANAFGKIASIHLDPFNDQSFMETDWWGVWKSTDGGQTMQEKITGAPNAVGTDLHFSGNGILYATTMDNGLLKSGDLGKKFQMVFPQQGYRPDSNGHVWRIVTSEEGKHIIATSSPWGQKVNQVIVSDDGGKHFTITRKGLPLTRPTKNTMWHEGYPRALAIDPNNSSRVYLGIDGDEGGGLFISDDGGKSWGKSSGQPGSLRIYNGLAVDPTDSNRIVWGACAKGGGVYLSEDRGKTWRRVFDRMKWVFNIVIDARGIMYALGDDNGAAIFQSADRGQTWARLSSFPRGRAAQALAIDPRNPDRLAVAAVNWGGVSPGAIYVSSDKGKNWVNVSGDLSIGSGASSIQFDPTGGFLFANLYAGSIWKLNVGAL